MLGNKALPNLTYLVAEFSHWLYYFTLSSVYKVTNFTLEVLSSAA